MFLLFFAIFLSPFASAPSFRGNLSKGRLPSQRRSLPPASSATEGSLLHLLSAEAAGRRRRPSCAPCAISVAGDLQACHLSLATGTPRPAHPPVLAQGSRPTHPGFHLSWHWVCPAWRDSRCWPGPCFAQKSSWWMAQAEGEPKTDMCADLGPPP